MPTLILFDIDGTLVLTGGAGSRAMAQAFEELFRVPDAFSGIPMPGRTDPLILADAAARHAVPMDQGRHARFREVYCAYLRAEIYYPGPRKGIMPGVRPLLEVLSRRDDVMLGLLTGNYEEAARIKLEYFELWHYFQVGAYGDEAPDRNALVPLAMSRARACGLSRLSPSDVLVVGDTPLDVACAAASRARAVAVATGNHDVAALAAAEPEVVFETLADTEAFLRLLGAGAG